MPRFDLSLATEAQTATEIVLAGETSRSAGRDEWTIKRLESLYELAYLRVFVAWESVLEDIFFRTLCGYASSAVGQERLTRGRYYSTLADAEAAVLGPKNRYILWENSGKIIARCAAHIGTPATPTTARIAGLQERIVASNSARLDALAAIRHRIVHDQTDGKNKFDQATLLFAGRTYPASRPGKFLRDTDSTSAVNRKWLDAATSELIGLASQMV